MKYRTHQFHWCSSVHTDTPTSFRCSRESWVSRLVIMAHFRSEQVCLSLAACLQTRRNWPTWVRDKAIFICHSPAENIYEGDRSEWPVEIFPVTFSPSGPVGRYNPPEYCDHLSESLKVLHFQLSIPSYTNSQCLFWLTSSPIFSLQPLFLPEGDRLGRWHSPTGNRNKETVFFF